MPRCLGLPCSAQQALALYRHLFGCPAGLGQLQAALQQVPERRACPPGLELPVMLLDMEQSRRAQEQLLWDLELLTGAGLGLFWPPRAQSYGLWGRGVRSWWDKPHGSTAGGSEQLSGGQHCPGPQPAPSGVLSHHPTTRAVMVKPAGGRVRGVSQDCSKQGRRAGSVSSLGPRAAPATGLSPPRRMGVLVGNTQEVQPSGPAWTAGLQGEAGTYFPAPSGHEVGENHTHEYGCGVGRYQGPPEMLPAILQQDTVDKIPPPTPSRVPGCTPCPKPWTP